MAADGGKTIVVDEPGSDPTAPPLVISREALDLPGTSAAEALGRQAGLSTMSYGDAAALTLLRIRGTNPNHVRLYMDGISLETADGSPGDLSELPLWSSGRIQVWRTNAPIGRGGTIGGALEVISRVPRNGAFELALDHGSFGSTRLSALGGWAPSDESSFVVGAVDLWRYKGDFPWTDDHGTLFDVTDDTPEVRGNNQARELKAIVQGGFDLSPTCRLRLLDHVLARARGLAGPAASLSQHGTHQRLANTAALSLRCARRGAWTLDAVSSLRFSSNEGHDPYGELSQIATHTLNEAIRPELALTYAHRLLPQLVLRTHADVGFEQLTASDLMGRSSSDFERVRAAAALEVAGSFPGLGLELSVRGRLDAYQDLEADGGIDGGWRVGAAYLGLRECGLSLQAGVGRAIRVPSIYELYGDGASVLPSPSLKPELGLRAAGTLGWAPRLSPEVGWLRFEATLFGHWIDDLIQFKRNTLRQAIAENEESAEILGLDFSVGADLLNHLRLSWTHTSLWSESLSSIPSRQGNVLPLRPAGENHVHAEGYGRSGDGSELRVFIDVDHVGSNTYEPAALVRLPPRVVVSIGFGWRIETDGLMADSGAWELGAVWRNILGAANLDLLGYPLPGRSMAARLSWRENFF